MSKRPLCTPGWLATREAWMNLFSKIVLILCFLHSVLKIKSRCRGELRRELSKRSWYVYTAKNKSEFSQRQRRLKEWALEKTSGKVQEAVLEMCPLKDEFLL
jgi:hypothetical protein